MGLCSFYDVSFGGSVGRDKRLVAVVDGVARSLIFFVVMVITAAISINYEYHIIGRRLVGAGRIDIIP